MYFSCQMNNACVCQFTEEGYIYILVVGYEYEIFSLGHVSAKETLALHFNRNRIHGKTIERGKFNNGKNKVFEII